MSDINQSEGTVNYAAQETANNSLSGDEGSHDNYENNSPGSLDNSGDDSQNEQSGVNQSLLKQRLGQQKKHYEKRIRQLEQQFREKEASLYRQQPIDYSPSYAAPSYQETPEAGSQSSNVRSEVMAAFRELKEQEQRAVEQAKQREQLAIRDRKIAEFQDSLIDASTRYDDFDEVVKNPDLPISQAMAEAAMFMPNGPDLLYHLGKNSAEVQRIARLDPYDQAREMVKLGMNLNNRPAVSNAPPPASPLGKGSSSSVSGIQNMSYSQLKQTLRGKRKR